MWTSISASVRDHPRLGLYPGGPTSATSGTPDGGVVSLLSEGSRVRTRGSAEFFAQGPQLLPCLRVVGLPVRARLPCSVEVAARDPLELQRGGQADDGLGSLLNGAHGVSEGAADHLGVHE